MRGGPLSEKRIINLVNRRFIPFFFNVGKNGEGYDDDAKKFIARFDKRFSSSTVPTPPVWVVTGDGKLLGTINNYMVKEKFFSALQEIMKKHPKYFEENQEEKDLLKQAEDTKDGNILFKAGQITEELGLYDKAKSYFKQAENIEGFKSKSSLELAKISRYEMNWDDAEKYRKLVVDKDYEAEVCMEEAHHLLSKKNYKECKELLVKTIKKFPLSKRLGEMHFYAGVSCFFLKESDWANFHWCWVMVNIPDDYYYMRCYLASTHEAMPYQNPELGGAKGKTIMISHAKADAARDRAMNDYKKLNDEFEKDLK